MVKEESKKISEENEEAIPVSYTKFWQYFTEQFPLLKKLTKKGFLLILL